MFALLELDDIIDPHHHYFDYKKNTFHEFLQANAMPKCLHLPSKYVEDAGSLPIVASVHVEANQVLHASTFAGRGLVSATGTAVSPKSMPVRAASFKRWELNKRKCAPTVAALVLRVVCRIGATLHPN